tara:strand:+ start:2631 stop:2861 length:231 start_codon:yes stop_codon:yes gene_type:complete
MDSYELMEVLGEMYQEEKLPDFDIPVEKSIESLVSVQMGLATPDIMSPDRFKNKSVMWVPFIVYADDDLDEEMDDE